MTKLKVSEDENKFRRIGGLCNRLKTVGASVDRALNKLSPSATSVLSLLANRSPWRRQMKPNPTLVASDDITTIQGKISPFLFFLARGFGLSTTNMVDDNNNNNSAALLTPVHAGKLTFKKQRDGSQDQHFHSKLRRRNSE